MGFFEKKKSIDELEEDGARLTIESDNAGKEAEIAEKRATIKELRKRYGPGWRSVLSLKGKVSLSTLQGFLGDAKRGLQGASRATYNPKLSPLPRRRE